jgi:hypothetical protein
LQTFFYGFGGYKYVVHIDVDFRSLELSRALSMGSLVYGWGVDETKRHPMILVQAIRGNESGNVL